MTVNLSRKGDVWYRFYDRSGTYIGIEHWVVCRVTPAGVWLGFSRHDPGPHKFVLLQANKRFASPTMQEAYTSFLARKRRQIRILTAQLANAESALELALEQGATGKMPPYNKEVRFQFSNFTD